MLKQLIFAGVVMIASACVNQTEQTMKVSETYPGVKLGFSTQNFLNSMTTDVENLKEIIDYASEKGYAFIELKDPAAELTVEECRILAAYALDKHG